MNTYTQFQKLESAVKTASTPFTINFQGYEGHSLIAPGYISKWSIITFINVLTHKRIIDRI